MLAERLQRRKALEEVADPAQEAVLAIYRANEALAGEAHKFFQSFGVTMQQFNVLRVLYVRSEDMGLRCSDIGHRLITREPDMTRLLDRLEKAELLRRVRCTEDRRVVWAQLTEKGFELVERIHDPLLHLHRNWLSHLTDEELETLRVLLDKVRRAPEEKG